MAASLQSPAWPGKLFQCLGCGYALDGHEARCQCPECGFEADERTLVLHGVMRGSTSTSWWRKLMWVLLIVFWIVVSNTWTMLVLVVGWYMVLLFVVGVAGVVVLVATSRRERVGQLAFVFTVGGFLPVIDVRDEKPEGVPMRWSDVRRVELQRVSPFWRKLRIYGEGRTLLDAGVRCPDDLAERVLLTLEAYRTGVVADGV